MQSLRNMKFYLRLLLAMLLVVNLAFLSIASAFGSLSFSIETENFRWTRFPLKVLIDMNQWSRLDYAGAVHEALNSWVHSIWNYTNAYGASLPNIDFRFYVSNVNATSNYDVFITFSSDEMGSGVVGLTSTRWDNTSHTPIAPITINVTTYHNTTYPLFVKNVVMHEFGHALGLGHTDSQTTSNGPELMYPRSTQDQVTYPSTLDIYALTRLYQGYYGQQVQLPPTIPYVMLSDGSVRPPSFTIWDTLFQDLIIIAILLLALVIALAVWRTRKKPEQPVEPTPPVEVPQNPSAWCRL
ncbi:MAG TPA: matrixin family metalloprotease [Candidatus Krumholzibacteriaceae bacterium]|nr:matrixin family metalloprotease [Candidatus Krumholzibacteriaceae bacterium]